MTAEKQADILQAIYYDASSGAGFASVEKLYKAAKVQDDSITRRFVKEWLADQWTYTLHRQRLVKFPRNRVRVTHIDEEWQADLTEMQPYAKENRGYRYLLTCIDVLSKYAWVVPIKSKTSTDVTDAFRAILQQKVNGETRRPSKLQTDNGSEFKNVHFKRLMDEYLINHFTTRNQDVKCSVVERFNRTLKNRMFKFFTAKGSWKYYDSIDKIVDGYNKSWHRAIRMRPCDVTTKNEAIARKNLYKESSKQRAAHARSRRSKVDTETPVRIQYKKAVFDRGYHPVWTDQTYRVHRTVKHPIVTYKLVDGKDRELPKTFYRHEIQPVGDSIVYRVEKVLRRKKHKGKEYAFVKWLKYPEEYNSWIPSENLINLG